MRGVCRLVWVSGIYFKTSQDVDVTRRGGNSFLMKETLRADEVTRQTGNFVRQTFKTFSGARGLLGQKLPWKPYALIRRRFLHEKNLGIPEQFSKKKIVLCRKPDEVTRIDGTSTGVSRSLSSVGSLGS
jgi:hypothetical protein